MPSLCFVSVLAALAAGPPAQATPEGRAVAYLSREVPRWSAENSCYSCHNNGDAARALYAAVRLSRPVPERALADTTLWLSRPERWDHNGGEGPATDKGLAHIQFAAALAAAQGAGLLQDRKPLTRAADLVARGQEADGSWTVGAPGTTGAPATYGTCLATALARRTLETADPARFREARACADRWLRGARVTTVLDAAGVLFGLEGADDPEARSQRRRCLELIRKGQGEDGGWGPYVTSASEPFDTAVVLLALVPLKEQPDCRPLLRRGRAYLLAGQRPDGSWPETTRPAGADSYAERLSTTGWATLALLATAP
jgi:hypothetical protein